jgi:hypothetical protein
MACDERFALVLIGQRSAAGASLHLRNFVESVENLTGSGQDHWMAGTLRTFATARYRRRQEARRRA